jgi:3-isopropylmalate/(R)-2-methylmalate dehydratase small subunit
MRELPPISGRVFRFGDQIDTDLLAPGAYMKRPIEELAQHCLEAIDPNFARSVRPCDAVVAGVGFGIGSSREQAAQALKVLGVGCVLARSFARIFYRNALNLGLPVLTIPDEVELHAGDQIAVDPLSGVIEVPARGQRFRCEAIPGFLIEMLADGGLMPHLKRRIERGEIPAQRRA